MITEDQTAVIDALASPSTHGGAPVERIDTHTAIVFLAGSRAWKLKRAVRFDYLDFSTVERRKAMCDAEVRLNRRIAPAVYRGVVAVTRAPDAASPELDRRGALLDARREAGLVRQCHGDLHLRNIVMLEGQPTLFDAVEFNDEIACIDVIYDLAFLLMDLWRRQLPRHANAVWNGYLAETADLDGVSLLPLFLSCRAAVRAKTSATAARVQDSPERAGELRALAREYLALAERLLHPAEPCLIAVGGFSGSGKSTLALGLAPSVGAVPGAVVLRSDEIRKRLCGVPLLERLGAVCRFMARRARAGAPRPDTRAIRGSLRRHGGRGPHADGAGRRRGRVAEHRRLGAG